MDAGSSFAADAAIYDRSRRQLIPCYEAFYGIAVEQSPFEAAAEIGILDLGAGTGLMSAFFADAHPRARLTLVDVAAEMLDRARERFARAPTRFTYAVMDYSEEALPGEFDLVVSCLSVHHLSDPAKEALFRKIHATLRPAGAFINADQVMGETPATDARNRARWLGGARRLGVSEGDLDAAIERMKHDRPATLTDQLRWLEEAGFCDVDCAFKDGMFAVYSGRR